MAPQHPTFNFDPDGWLRMPLKLVAPVVVFLCFVVWGYATVTGKLDSLARDVATLKDEQAKMAKDLNVTTSTVQQMVGYTQAKSGVSALHLPKLIDELPAPSP